MNYDQASFSWLLYTYPLPPVKPHDASLLTELALTHKLGKPL